MFQDLTLNELQVLQNKGPHTLIDVRSPSEFTNSTIPGSINIPLFTDKERAEVGTIYKQVGKEEAKDRGLEIFSEKLPSFIQAFKQIETPMTVFCWRGGMRSKTAATVLDLMGVHANRLHGGYRTYRQWVIQQLEKEEFSPKIIVLSGYTGSGKTELLKKLDAAGYPVIDFESLAGHRGSIFGQIGLEPSNQKKFDSLLVQDLQRLKDAPYVLVEDESRRIGKVCIPTFIFDKKEHGLHLIIDLPITERVQNILTDYEPWNYPERFIEAFQIIKKRLHLPIANQIEAALSSGNYTEATTLLLEYYYDRRYEHSNKEKGIVTSKIITANNTDDVFLKLLDSLEGLKQI